MKKTVDVFLRDRLIASYPVAVMEVDRPMDDDYTAQVERYMRRHYSKHDVAAAKFVVRGPLD